MKLLRQLCLLGIALLFSSVISAQAQNGNTRTSRTMNDARSPNIVMAIHGGAGTILKKNMTPETEAAYRAKLTEALEKGYELLSQGESSVDAIEAAIHILEDSPLFNAGKGAVFTNEGTNELDASIMDGKTLNAGAVGGVKTVRHPISAARKVMENSPHVMLTGAGADTFAKEKGLEIVDNKYFHTDRRYKSLQKVLAEEKAAQMDKLSGSKDDRLQKNKLIKKGTLNQKMKKGKKEAGSPRGEANLEIRKDIDPFIKDHKFGTVGAAALDKFGNLAAGTSTGGMTNKRYGRVGDSPIIGAGTYANNGTCAVSATGHGEYFIRNVVCYDISALMEYGGKSLEDAANYVVKEKLVALKGSGGVIAVDHNGNVAMPFNTEGMYRGYIGRDGVPHVFIYKEE
ncbi:MAG: isoaspartyl peptidase/L-asparaginase family protein [Chitinophagales bacterium]